MKFYAVRTLTLLLVMTLGLSLHTQASTPSDPAPETPIGKFLKEHKNISQNTRDFYEQNNYVAVWYPNGQESVAAQTAKQVLKTSDTEGLNPTDYQKAWITDYKKDWVKAEIDLTNTFLKFIDHVRVGRIPAQDVARSIKLTSPKTDPVKLLTEALKDNGGNFKKLTQMAPDLPDYQNLKILLQQYKSLAEQWGTLPTIERINAKVGESSPSIPAVKKILTAYGYYSGQSFDDIYTQELFDAVKNFQHHNNLEVDGVIGPQTSRVLNIPLETRIHKIIINMERLRWLPDDMGERHIIVNVGGYEVLAVRNNKTEIRMRAIVGQVGRRTPLFYAPLRDITINPSWGVPRSILVRDKIPKIINDPTYLERAGYVVYDSSGNRISPHNVDWYNNGSGISLRQKPGFRNALGRIRLNIINPYTIFLHGTPTGKLFEKPRRNFSSGCIRLEEPNKLSAWVLKDENGWDESTVQQQINTGRTITVPIKEKLPVYFTYQTVWVADDGKPHFSPDAYNMDDRLIDLLKLKDQPLTKLASQTYKIRYA